MLGFRKGTRRYCYDEGPIEKLNVVNPCLFALLHICVRDCNH